jgi:hypothetical protein
MSILLKFVLVLLGIYVGFYLLWKLFGKAISRYLMKSLINRAQKSMNDQSRQYQRHAHEYSPFEDSVYIEDDVKVTIRRGDKHDKNEKPSISSLPVEEVDFEDVE